jgi:hypothetical protein
MGEHQVTPVTGNGVAMRSTERLVVAGVVYSLIESFQIFIQRVILATRFRPSISSISC